MFQAIVSVVLYDGYKISSLILKKYFFATWLLELDWLSYCMAMRLAFMCRFFLFCIN